MLSGEEYLKRLIEEVEESKSKGKKAVFRKSARITAETADMILDYFEPNPKYRITLTRCASCRNTTWDIVIRF